MHTITPSELISSLKEKNTLLIDIREPFEHRGECLKNSQNIPLNGLNTKSLPSHCGPVVFYCDSGNRSREAVQKILKENPYLAVSNLEGGLHAFKKQGCPILKTGKKAISVMRQVQMIAGGLTLLGVLLGTFAHPYFYGLSGFIGAGLLFSGLSGTCAMARILGFMPWNR